MDEKPNISIAVISYRQEAFIEQTLHGIAKQRFQGTVEVIIGDDASPDRTLAIIQENTKDFPFPVNILPSEKNLGMVGNWLRVLSACKGKYVAICEGDDYWTDPDKLQKQFDAMEARPDVVMTWHKVEVLWEGVQRPYPYEEGFEECGMKEVILHHFIPTCSLVYRNGLIPSWPDWIHRALGLDMVVEMLLAAHGRVLQLPGKMGVYRQHPGGISKSPQSVSLGVLRQIEMLRHVDEFTQERFAEPLGKKMVDLARQQLKMPENEGLRHWKKRWALFKYIRYAHRFPHQPSFKDDVYKYLIPKTYQKIKGVK